MATVDADKLVQNILKSKRFNLFFMQIGQNPQNIYKWSVDTIFWTQS